MQAPALTAPFALIGRHRKLLFATTASELRATYAGSILGIAWIFLGPLLLLAIYGAVYAVIFKVQPADMSTQEYVLYVFSGLVPFITFSMALTAGSMSISINRALLLNTVFPIELIAVRSVLVASASLPAGMLILLVGNAIFGHFTALILLLPVVIVLQTMFVVGVCWIVSLIALLIQDIEQILIYLTMILLVMTPIAYTPAMVPAQLHLLQILNPLYYYVTAYQYIVVLGEMPPLGVIIGSIALAIAAFLGGYFLSRRVKQALVDFA
jgi:lipopolysaccharide transport system permease protein